MSYLCKYAISSFALKVFKCTSPAFIHWSAALGPVDWRWAVCEAEKTVGFPTSFLELRKLFDDDVASAAIRLRRLVETNHPMLRSTKHVLLGEKSNLQSLSLAVLLVCKAAGYEKNQLCPSGYLSDSAGILNCQRVLAEIVEMKRNFQIIEKTDLLNDSNVKTILSDDKLLSYFGQYNLKDTGAFELISTGVRDLIRADTIGDRDPNNRPLPGRPKDDNTIKEVFDWEIEEPIDFDKYAGQARDEWTFRTMLTSGSILSKGCQAAVKIASHSRSMESKALALGGHLALTWQLYLDIKDFYFNSDSFSLVGAPVMYAIEEYPDIYERVKSGKEGYKFVNFKILNNAVRSTRAIEHTREFLEREVDTCLKSVEHFNNKEAKEALKNLVLAVYTESTGYLDQECSQY